MIVGDFNIAPLECDVWSHKALVDVVSHTPIEIAALERLRAAHDWVDLGRAHIPAPQRNFTWWSYRSKDHTANDRGRRLDHMWASPSLAAQRHRAPRARTVPQLGAPVGPCAADRRVRSLSDPAPLDRAIAALRAGRAVGLEGLPLLAVETATPALLDLLDPGAQGKAPAQRTARRRARAWQ